MKINLFIDTGALIGRVAPGDQHEAAAQQGWREMETSGSALFSSEPVLIESANYLTRKQGGRFAAEWLRRHWATTEIRWLQPSREDLEGAFEHLEKFSDQRISFTDTISFALMHRHKIHRVFGFDRHFSLAGFELWPQ